MAVSILTVKDRQDDRKALTFQQLHEGRDSCLTSHESRKASLRIFLKTVEPFAFAGIWEENTDSDGHPTQTFAIITTEANAIVAPIHTRMLVLLQPETEPA